MVDKFIESAVKSHVKKNWKKELKVCLLIGCGVLALSVVSVFFFYVDLASDTISEAYTLTGSNTGITDSKAAFEKKKMYIVVYEDADGNELTIITDNPESVENVKNIIPTDENEQSDQTGQNTTAPDVEVSDPETAMYDYLKGKGYSLEQICGILGNLHAESGCNPKTTQGHSHDGQWVDGVCNKLKSDGTLAGGDGHGVVQWDGSRRGALKTTADNLNKNWWDISVQITYLDFEIANGDKKIMPNISPEEMSSRFESDKLNGATDPVEHAAYMWCRYFERCRGVHWDTDTYASRTGYDGWTRRKDNALAMYAKYKGR